MRRTQLVGVFLYVTLGASCSKRSDERTLSERVELYCHDVQANIRQASAEYDQLAGWIDGGQLNTGQLRRAESVLPYGSTLEARRPVSHALVREIDFCVSVRNISDVFKDEMIGRSGLLQQDFAEASDQVGVAHALDLMLPLIQEANATPLRNEAN